MINVGIVGGTGYTGVELLRILSQHPEARLTMITSRKEAGTPVADMYPSLRGFVDLAFSDTATADLTRCDVVFYATPHGVAMADAPRMMAAGVKIIDLAADFRLQDAAKFEEWYKLPHTAPDLLAEAAYGLVELNREAIRTARIVANPGCYPTTMQLGFAPLLQGGHVDASHLIADCKSGVSGAGRKAELGTAFSEAADNFKSYGVTGHRHHPETVEKLQQLSDEPVGLIFTPHLVPMIRGMHSTLYARLKPGPWASTCRRSTRRRTDTNRSSTCCRRVRCPIPARLAPRTCCGSPCIDPTAWRATRSCCWSCRTTS